MSTPVTNILRSAVDQPDKLNIACFFLDGRFEEVLVKTGHNIYGAKESFVADYLPCKGLKYLPLLGNQIDRDILFDLVLYNYPDSQLKPATAFSNSMHIPKMGIQHFSSATISVPEETVYVHQFLKDSFDIDTGEVIPYGIPDVGESEEDRDIDILVHGNFTPNDGKILKHLSGLQVNLVIAGNNPGVSQPVTDEELATHLKKTKIFLNLSTHDGMPYSGLLAMMCGCAIISNTNGLVKQVFNEEFSKLVNNVADFAPTINNMLTGNWQDMGKKARTHALQHYELEANALLWKDKLQQKAREVYTR